MTREAESGPRCRARLTILAAAAAVLLAGCSGGQAAPAGSVPVAGAERTPEAYCEAFYSRAAPQRERYEQISRSAGDGGDGTLAAIFTALGAPGQLAVVFDGMVPHAPDEIRAETEASAAALRQLQENLGDGVTDPLGTAVKNLVNSAGSSASFDAVGAYLEQHCPIGSPIAARYGATPAPAALNTSPSPSLAVPGAGSGAAPPVGTTLASPSGEGGFSVVTNNRSGFSVVRTLRSSSADQSDVTVYDASGHELAKVAQGNITGDCGAADLTTPSGRRLILTQEVVYTEPAGVTAESYAKTLTAWDVATGSSAWELELISAQANRLDCDIYSGSQGLLDSFASTRDGKWGVHRGGAAAPRSQIIDLESGRSLFQGDVYLSVLGNYLSQKSPDQYQRPVDVLTAPDRKRTFRVPSDKVSGEVLAASSGVLAPASEAALVSPDGEMLFHDVDVSPRNGSLNDARYQMVAWRLADGKEVWRGAKGPRQTLVATGGGVLIAADGDERLSGLDAATGKELWTLPHGDVCGLTDSQFMLAVNDQLAVIDVRSGKQLSYDDQDDGCPDLRAGGIQVAQGDIDPTVVHGTTVTQVLNP